MPYYPETGTARDLGKYWEEKFCEMATEYGFMFTPMQIGKNLSAVAYYTDGQQVKTLTLPDVTIWTNPGQHHEIKHKNPTRYGQFGLEAYRFHALMQFARITKQLVLYTIHNHDLSGGPLAKMNNIDHWVTTDVQNLIGKYSSFYGQSIIDGVMTDHVLIYYWPIVLWCPLRGFWEQKKA